MRAELGSSFFGEEPEKSELCSAGVAFTLVSSSELLIGSGFPPFDAARGVTILNFCLPGRNDSQFNTGEKVLRWAQRIN